LLREHVRQCAAFTDQEQRTAGVTKLGGNDSVVDPSQWRVSRSDNLLQARILLKVFVCFACDAQVCVKAKKLARFRADFSSALGG
jgi:hypothetical protein